MNHLITYLLKVILCSAIFFAYYLIALRNKNFHPYNRFYLLSTAIMSTLLPLLHISMFDFSSDNARMLALFQMLGSGQLPDVVVGNAPKPVNWEQVVLLVSLSVSSIMIVLMVIRIAKVFRLKRRFPSRTIGNVNFINTNIKQAPFSFLNNLFWRKDILLADKVGEQIYRHEMAHIRQKHSLDKLLFQVLRAVFWMNPVYYYMQRELLLIHEFMADQKAIEDGDGEAFARMLLATQFEGFRFEPAHPLSYSSIKKRLHMITNSHKPKYSYLRRLLFLPLLFSVTFVFALRAHQKQMAEQQADLEAMVAEQQEKVSFTEAIDSKEDTGNTAQQMQKAVVFNRVDSAKPAKLSLYLQKDSSGSTPKPLIIIDDKEQTADYSLDALDPSDIESIHVYKDKYATGKFGQKGKDGVVSVTTKAYAAKSGQTRMSGDVNVVGFKKSQDSTGKVPGQSTPQTFTFTEDSEKKPQNDVVVVGYKTAGGKPNGAQTGKTDRRAVTIVGYGNKEAGDGRTPHIFTTTEDAAAVENNTQNEIVVQGRPSKTGRLKGKVIGMHVRGTNGTPLYIMDGKKITAEEMKAISPDDIESISVLKDKSGIEKYGAEGENGVVLITSKAAAKASKVTVTIDNVDKEPTYPGGPYGWKKYLERNLQSSIPVKNGAPEGTYTIVLSFLVNKQGEVSEIKAIQKPEKDYGTAAEAVRVIKESGNWIPAKQNGKDIGFRTKQKVIFQVSK